MKRGLAILIFLGVLLSAAPARAYEIPAYLKIGLFFGASAVDEIEIHADGELTLCGGEAEGFAEIKSLGAGRVVVSKGGEGFEIAGESVSAQGGVSIKSDNGIISAGGRKYRGFILITRLENSDMTVVNVVDTEEYLFSVLGMEMSPSWNIEALKAQAVCARTFAVTQLNKYAKYGFNLCDTTASQVYRGISTEAESTIRAVEETRGQIITYDGKPAQTYYFATSGGVTEAPENVWSSAVAYLKSVDDPYEAAAEATNYRWEKTFKKEDIKRILGDKGIDVGDITSLEIAQRAPSNRAVKLTIFGTKGEHSWTKDAIRGAFGAGSLPSQMFEIQPFAWVVSARGKTELGSGAAVLSAGGVGNLKSSEVFAIGANGKAALAGAGDEIVIRGSGWGHAVGMSQWGAKGMADAGKTYTEIIEHYFTGVRIE